MLVLIAFLASADAASAQESEAFNAADPGMQQAIKNQRAMNEEQHRAQLATPTPESSSAPPPEPARQDDADADQATSPTIAPNSPPDCRILPDGSFTMDDGLGRCPELTTARTRSERRSRDTKDALQLLLASAGLLLLGRGLRYVLTDE